MSDNSNKVLDAIKKRRTIRSYFPKPVSYELIEVVLGAAHWSPSAANRQPWLFIIVKDPVMKKEVQKLVEENRKATIDKQQEPYKTRFSNYKTNWVANAPIHIVVCSDPKKTGPPAGGSENRIHPVPFYLF